MLPFIPGMIGSRKKGDELRDIYSGVEPVPIHAGRWWEVGSTAFEGSRIKEWRPHWSILHKTHAEDAALYGSEGEKWKHNPLIHPVRYLRNPYFLEQEHYADRPYPVSSPAFTNVPLIGPLLAATVGKPVERSSGTVLELSDHSRRRFVVLIRSHPIRLLCREHLPAGAAAQPSSE